MIIKRKGFFVEIEDLLIIILISFFFSDKIKLFLTSYFVCYLFMMFHETSHILFATLFGKRVRKIKLSVAGVCAIFSNDELDIVKELIVYVAGPISNLCLALTFKNIKFVFETNIFLCILNLLPIYPLDGYNIIKAIFRYYGFEMYLKYIEYIIFCIFLVLSLYILVKYYNPSLTIFLIYIMLIKCTSKNQAK